MRSCAWGRNAVLSRQLGKMAVELGIYLPTWKNINELDLGNSAKMATELQQHSLIDKHSSRQLGNLPLNCAKSMPKRG